MNVLTLNYKAIHETVEGLEDDNGDKFASTCITVQRHWTASDLKLNMLFEAQVCKTALGVLCDFLCVIIFFLISHRSSHQT